MIYPALCPPTRIASIFLFSHCFLPSNAFMSQMPPLNLIKVKKLLIASITLKSYTSSTLPSFSPDHFPPKKKKSSPTENQILGMPGSEMPASLSYKDSVWVMKNPSSKRSKMKAPTIHKTSLSSIRPCTSAGSRNFSDL